MKTAFKESGYSIVQSGSVADVIVINSCTVTSSGDSRVLSALRKMRANSPNAVIALTGCYPQAFAAEASAVTEADIVIGTKERLRLIEIVGDFLVCRERTVSISEYGADDKFEIVTCGEFTENTRAFVKIQDGCNRFCSYCIIPFARGRCRSKPIDILKTELAEIAGNGTKEAVLTGINLAFYGREFGLNLADAVETACGIEGLERIRLGSLEPDELCDGVLDRLAEQRKLCPQFHLSLQSGCDRTLKAMNRKYDAAEYRSLVEKLRKRFPDCAITTDIMIGFPGETDGDFEQSLEFVREIGFAKVHVFRYSRRKGTAADRMDGQIPENIKSERWHKMTEAAEHSRTEHLKGMVGKTVPVLFEKENCENFYRGYAPDYTPIKIPKKIIKNSLRNSIFYVIIKGYDYDFCKGEFIDVCF